MATDKQKDKPFQLSQSDKDADWIKYVDPEATRQDREATAKKKKIEYQADGKTPKATAAEAEKEGHWVTINGNPVFIEGPEEGGKSARGHSSGGHPAANVSIKDHGKVAFGADRARSVLTRLPDDHVEGLQSITLASPEDMAQAQHATATGVYWEDPPHIYVATKGRKGPAIEETLRHEVGHHVYRRVRPSSEYVQTARKFLGQSDLTRQDHQDFWLPIRIGRTKGTERGERELFAVNYALYTSGKMSSSRWQRGTRKVFYNEMKRIVGD